MTCIVGLVHEGTVHLGGDSAGSSGWDLTIREDAKVFRSGPYVIGFSTSFRMGQLLRYAFAPPEPPIGDLHGFMCTAFVNALRACLKDGGWAEKKDEREKGGSFLVGISGRLFEISDDYQVGESADPFHAVGCGDQVARGSLYSTPQLTPLHRLEIALSAAERYSNGVRGPFRYVSTT